MSPSDGAEKPQRPDGEETSPRRGALIAVVVILVLAVAGWWIAAQLHKASSIQDCVMQGRRNCAPISN